MASINLKIGPITTSLVYGFKYFVSFTTFCTLLKFHITFIISQFFKMHGVSAPQFFTKKIRENLSFLVQVYSNITEIQ